MIHDQLCYLCVLFLCLEAVFGLKINLAKLKLVLVCNVNNVDVLVGILTCGVSSLTLKYIGLLLGAFYKAKPIGMVLLRRDSVSCLVRK
jgi:hypothetical protein